MAFELGHTKMGGRQKGNPNKKTLMKAEELLVQLGVNPIQKLIEIAESENASLDQQINCYKEIAKYTYHKPKTQDMKITQDDQPNVVKVLIVDPANS